MHYTERAKKYIENSYKLKDFFTSKKIKKLM